MPPGLSGRPTVTLAGTVGVAEEPDNAPVALEGSLLEPGSALVLPAFADRVAA